MLQENPETITYIPTNHCIDTIKQELQMVPIWTMWEYLDYRISFYEWLLNHLGSLPQRNYELIGDIQKSFAYLLEERIRLHTNETLQLQS